MAVLTLADACLAFGHVALLDHAALVLEPGERVGLIGRNGTGKSSLLKILAGIDLVDDGTLQVQQGLRRCYLPQEPQFVAGISVFDAVSEGLAEVRDLRARYEAHEPHEDLDALQTRIEALSGWTWEQRVDATLERLGLDPATGVDALSGGLKKRVALAQALVAAPDVLLLDEPTNHLDLDAILWLQELLNNFAGTLMVITHDRAFLDAVSTRIVELDRGQIRSYPGNYAAFEAAKLYELQNEALANARADKLLAQEEIWIRKGVEARRTRSVARIGRLEQLRATRVARRDIVGKVRIEADTGAAGGKLVAELEGIAKSYGDKVVVRDFSATILRGDKVGLIGPNGAGKTTLLKMILGELAPDSGKARLGSNLQVAYFDQMRAALDLDKTLADTISPGSEWIEIAGARKHVMSYLTDFLFSPARANSPVRSLSGGERNRLLLARLLARPANVLVLDEPTNDLDIETLELLEQLLQDYPGTVFLVSHDRRFLDAVVTSTLVSEGAGRWREYEGGVEDWLMQSRRAASLKASGGAAVSQGSATPTSGGAAATPASGAAAAGRSGGSAPAAPGAGATPAASAVAAATSPARRKLSFREQRELDELPARIEQLEAEQKELGAELAGTELYTRTPERIAAVQSRYEAIELALLDLLERWEALGAR